MVACSHRTPTTNRASTVAFYDPWWHTGMGILAPPSQGIATPLYVSAQNGHAKVVRALLEAGADINLTCSQANGMTPALCAALLGHEEVEKLLRRAPSKVCGNPSCKHTAWTASMKGEFKKCSGCLGVKYCSQSCQRVHWKEHKKVCNKS